MAHEKRSEFLDRYRQLCEETKCYVDTGYGKPLYVMSILYPVDRSFERTMKKLEEDIG